MGLGIGQLRPNMVAAGACRRHGECCATWKTATANVCVAIVLAPSAFVLFIPCVWRKELETKLDVRLNIISFTAASDCHADKDPPSTRCRHAFPRSLRLSGWSMCLWEPGDDQNRSYFWGSLPPSWVRPTVGWFEQQLY